MFGRTMNRAAKNDTEVDPSRVARFFMIDLLSLVNAFTPWNVLTIFCWPFSNGKVIFVSPAMLPRAN
jgi:hypothetical protein